MRFTVIFLAACSNAARPLPDASLVRADAPMPVDAAPDAPSGSLRIVVINEVAAGENPDWFEIVNATTSSIQLSDFIFVDNANDFTKAVPFPAQVLGPGGFATQNVDGVVVPFKLASDEELWVYRASDHALSDGVDWNTGDSPTGGSYARIPDTFAAFVTSAHPTKGTPNQP